MPKLTRAAAAAVLGVDEAASESEVKKAYHKLALLHHPDKASPDDKDAAGADVTERARARESAPPHLPPAPFRAARRQTRSSRRLARRTSG